MQGAGRASEAWAWEYRGKYQDGSASSWPKEDAVKGRFSLLHLDVFHALWEDFHETGVTPRPPGATRGEREVAKREAALQEFPLNKEVGRELQDNDGNIILTLGNRLLRPALAGGVHRRSLTRGLLSYFVGEMLPMDDKLLVGEDQDGEKLRMEDDETFAPRQGGKSTWTHVKISGTKEWHTATDAPASAAGATDVGDMYGEGESSTHGGGHLTAGSVDLSTGASSERNLFRMTDSLADKTFSFAPAETPPLSPSAAGGGSGNGGDGPRFQRKLRSASDSHGQQASLGVGGGGGGGNGEDAKGQMVPRVGPKSISQRQFFRPVSMSSAVFTESPIPGILRRRLAGKLHHGLSQAEFAVRRDGKLLLATVGLPARGKTYIAQSIKRHMDWFGLRTEIFNAGNYRRKFPEGRHASSDLFDPMNAEGAKLRQRCAEMALNDALDILASEEQGVYIAVLDATNTTRERRAWIREKVEAHEGHVKLVCLETVLTDDKKVWDNVKDAKLKSPDYKGMTAEEAMEDFFKRIEQYKSVYEPCHREEGIPFIRLTNAGEEVLGFKTQGFLCARIMQLVDSLRLSLRPILLTRCGECEFEAQGRIGGDSRLTPVGHLYAEALARGLLQGRKRYGILPVVWTSTRLRARQTVIGLQTAVNDANEEAVAEGGEGEDGGGYKGDGGAGGRSGSLGDLDVLEVSALDEIDAGELEGMHADDFAKHYPEHHKKRVADKLNVKFPDGENYRDVFARLESLLLEMVAEPQPVVVVAHLGVLRVIYGYLKGVEPAQCPHLKIPMHCVLQLNPKGYGYEEWRHYPLMDSKSVDDQPVRRATS
eukprot:g9918.t2